MVRHKLRLVPLKIPLFTPNQQVLKPPQPTLKPTHSKPVPTNVEVNQTESTETQPNQSQAKTKPTYAQASRSRPNIDTQANSSLAETPAVRLNVEFNTGRVLTIKNNAEDTSNQGIDFKADGIATLVKETLLKTCSYVEEHVQSVTATAATPTYNSSNQSNRHSLLTSSVHIHLTASKSTAEEHHKATLILNAVQSIIQALKKRGASGYKGPSLSEEYNLPSILQGCRFTIPAINYLGNKRTFMLSTTIPTHWHPGNDRVADMVLLLDMIEALKPYDDTGCMVTLSENPTLVREHLGFMRRSKSGLFPQTTNLATKTKTKTKKSKKSTKKQDNEQEMIALCCSDTKFGQQIGNALIKAFKEVGTDPLSTSHFKRVMFVPIPTTKLSATSASNFFTKYFKVLQANTANCTVEKFNNVPFQFGENSSRALSFLNYSDASAVIPGYCNPNGVGETPSDIMAVYVVYTNTLQALVEKKNHEAELKRPLNSNQHENMDDEDQGSTSQAKKSAFSSSLYENNNDMHNVPRTEVYGIFWGKGGDQLEITNDYSKVLKMCSGVSGAHHRKFPSEHAALQAINKLFNKNFTSREDLRRHRCTIPLNATNFSYQRVPIGAFFWKAGSGTKWEHDGHLFLDIEDVKVLLWRYWHTSQSHRKRLKPDPAFEKFRSYLDQIDNAGANESSVKDIINDAVDILSDDDTGSETSDEEDNTEVPKPTGDDNQNDMDVEEEEYEHQESSQSTTYANGIPPPPKSAKRHKRSSTSLSPSSVPTNKRTCQVSTRDGQGVAIFPEGKFYLAHPSMACLTAADARYNINNNMEMEDYGSMLIEESLNEHYESIHLMQANQVRGLIEYEGVGTHLLYICTTEAARDLLKEKLLQVGILGHKVNTFNDFTPPKWSTSTDPIQEDDEPEFIVIESNRHLEQLASNDLVRYAKIVCPAQESLELVKLLKKDESVQQVTKWLSTLDQKQPSF